MPVQKIALADYNIGMQNVKSSFAISDELVNMVDAGVKAKIYIDNTKREYERLNLMEGWNQANLDAKADFSKATTPEGQMEAIEKFKSTFASNTKSWNDIQGNTPQAQQQLVWLRNNANQQLSQMEMTHQNTLVKRTSAQHQLTMNRMGQSLVQDRNADPISGLKVIQDGYSALIKMDQMTQGEALYNFELQKDKIITGRSNLFAQDYANEILATGANPPTDAEFQARMETVMGISLNERRMELVRETFSDTYYKEITEANRQDSAEERQAQRAILPQLQAFKAQYKADIADGAITEDKIVATVETAKAFDTAWNPGYSKTVENELRNLKWGASNASFVEYFTEGQGGDNLRLQLKPKNSNFIDLAELETALRTQKGEYGGMNETTIRNIVVGFRRENDAVLKNTNNATPAIIKSEFIDALKKDKSILDTDLMPDGMWDKLQNTTSLNWKEIFTQDPEYNLGYAEVEGLLAKHFGAETGPFKAEYMKLPLADRINYVRDFARLAIHDVFGKITGTRRKAKAQESQKFAEDARNRLVDTSVSTTKASMPAQTPRPVPEFPAEIKLQRNAQFALKFQKQMQAGETTSALGTAVASKLSDVFQKMRDMHEASKATYAKKPTHLNERAGNLKEMATTATKIKESMAGELATKFFTGAKQDWNIATEDLARNMAQITGFIGSRLIDGMDNETIENQPMPKPPEATVAPDVSSAPAPIDSNQQAQVVSDIQVPDMLPQPVTTPIIPPEIVEAATPIIQNLSNQIAPQPANAIADVPDVPVIDPLDPNYDIDADLKQRFEAIERSTARHKRSIKLSQRAGWPKGGTPESDAIERQLDKEFPDTIQSVGKGLSEPIDAEMTFRQAPSDEERANWQARHRADIAAFIANKYNASKKKQQVEYAEHATEGLKKYHDGKLNKRQQINLTSLLATLNKAKSSFSGDLKYIGMPYEEFLDHMIGIYSAETNFGTSKSKVSETDVVGELQVTRGSFRDVVKPDGNFGKLMAKAAGFTIQELRELADKKNDKKLRTLLLNNKKLNYLAGAAILLSKLQYQ